MLPRIVIKRSRSFFFLSVSRHFERTWITLTGINVTNCLESNLSVAGELKDTRLDSRACASLVYLCDMRATRQDYTYGRGSFLFSFCRLILKFYLYSFYRKFWKYCWIFKINNCLIKFKICRHFEPFFSLYIKVLVLLLINKIFDLICVSLAINKRRWI